MSGTSNISNVIVISGDTHNLGLPVKPSRHKSGTKPKRKKRMKSNRVNFTQGWVDRLEAKDKRQQFYDTKVKHLVLEVMTSGSKFYRYRRTVDGKDQRATLGSADLEHREYLTLDNARREAELKSADQIGGHVTKPTYKH